jgi:hypothetical protein
MYNTIQDNLACVGIQDTHLWQTVYPCLYNLHISFLPYEYHTRSIVSCENK